MYLTIIPFIYFSLYCIGRNIYLKFKTFRVSDKDDTTQSVSFYFSYLTPSFLVGSVLLIFKKFIVLSYYVYLRSEFRVVMSVSISAYKDVRFVVPSSCL